MPPIWKRRNHDPVETLLRANRPEPRPEYMASVLGRLDSRRRRFPGADLRRRVVVAGLATALAAGAAVAAGGTSAVSTGLTGLVQAAAHGVKGAPDPVNSASQQGNGNGPNANAGANANAGNQGNGGQGGGQGNGGSTTANTPTTNGNPSNHQYAVTICHQTGSSSNPWVPLTLSPQGAANHLAHHPGDFIVTPSSPCPPS